MALKVSISFILNVQISVFFLLSCSIFSHFYLYLDSQQLHLPKWHLDELVFKFLHSFNNIFLSISFEYKNSLYSYNILIIYLK